MGRLLTLRQEEEREDDTRPALCLSETGMMLEMARQILVRSTSKRCYHGKLWLWKGCHKCMSCFRSSIVVDKMYWVHESQSM